MKTIFNILICLVSAASFAQGTGSISGLLTDKETGDQPLPFANVTIKGTTKGTTTDFDGLYQIENIEPGTYTLVFSFVGYETLEVPNVNVEANKVTTIHSGLGASAAALDEVLIQVVSSREKETALLLEQKKAVEMKQSIGAQELARKGVSDAEGAVTKTTGVTKVSSRGVFVRGLDERYSFLTLNNLPIAPVNWENKIPSLDLFTSSVISKIDVNKVFYSNLYGDFAGASINVDSKEMPNSSATKVSFSAGVNLQSLDNDFLTDKENGELNYFGFGGVDAREAPAALANENYNAPRFTATGQDAVNAFESDWNTEQIDTPISTGMSISNEGVISRKENGDRTAYYFGMSFSNDFDSQIGNSFLRNPQGSLLRDIERNNSFSYKTNANALFSLFHKTEKNYINFNYLFLKTTSNSVSDNYGSYPSTNADLLGGDSKYLQSYLSQFQLKGTYTFNPLNSLDYAVTYGDSEYSQPDNNVITLEELSGDRYVFASNSGRLYKYFLDSENYNIGGHLGYNLNFETNKSEDFNTLKFGGDMNYERLDVYNRYMNVQLTNTGRIFIDPNDIDGTLNQSFLDERARYVERLDTRYLDIQTEVAAGFANYNHNFSDKFNVLAGLRLENFVRTLGDESIPAQATEQENQADPFEFSKVFVLPSLNMRYSLSDNSNLRFAASKTYTKPKNIEIVNITRQNSLGDLIQGNPELENSDNYNVDLKYEIFPDKNSLFSVNLFGKYIDKPIERLVQNSGSYIVTIFANTDQAYIYGAEFEFKTTLGYLLKQEQWNDLSFGANVTLMNSETNISDDLMNELNLTNSSRPLQGASDFLLNADISYNADFSENYQSTFTFLFNTYSKRISRVGSGSAEVKYDDEYEQPFNNLSFIWKNKFNDKFSASFKINNLLDDTYERTIEGNGEQLSNLSYKVGRSLSLSLGYEF